MLTLTEKMLMLRPEDIRPSENQPRKSFGEYELKLLADSISKNGVIQPLTVRKSRDGKYELIAGERRLRAAKMAGLRRIPCVVHRADDTTAAIFAVTENLQRCDLNFFEEASAIERLINDFGLSQQETAMRLGIAQSTLCNKLRILRLSPEIKDRILAAGLTERHARELLRIPPEKREDTLDKIIAGALNLRQTAELIDEILCPLPKQEILPETMPEKEPTPVRKAYIGDMRLFANSLSKLVITMKNAGIKAYSRKYETEKYIEYKVRIDKNDTKPGAKQLKIC